MTPGISSHGLVSRGVDRSRSAGRNGPSSTRVKLPSGILSRSDDRGLRIRRRLSQPNGRSQSGELELRDRLPEERMLPQVPRERPLHWILLQTLGHKVAKSLGVCIGESRSRILWYVEDGAHGMKMCQWRLTHGELDGSDAERPDVGATVIPGLLDDLWCHPEWGAHKCVPSGSLRGDLRGDAKVRQLADPGPINQDVGSLDVAVYATLGVKVGKTGETLLADQGDMSFREPWHPSDVEHRSTLHEFHDYAELCAGDEALVVLRNVRLVAGLQEGNLSLQLHDILLRLFEVYHLDRDHRAIGPAKGLPDRAERPGPQLLEQDVVLEAFHSGVIGECTAGGVAPTSRLELHRRQKRYARTIADVHARVQTLHAVEDAKTLSDGGGL